MESTAILYSETYHGHLANAPSQLAICSLRLNKLLLLTLWLECAALSQGSNPHPAEEHSKGSRNVIKVTELEENIL